MVVLRGSRSCSYLKSLPLFAAILFLFLAAAGCTPRDPRIEVRDPHAYLSPMFLGAGTIFLTIGNAGGRDVLLSASLGLPLVTVELHDINGGRMTKVDSIEIPARSTIEMTPGGIHLMVFNLPRSVKEGSTAVLTLTFERSGTRTVQVQFEPSSAVR
jgi:copper(I)-binding protein